jgi:hypothetical protein
LHRHSYYTELRATSVLRVGIEAASLKARSGPPKDDEEDYALPIWGGVVPLKMLASAPQDDDAIPPETVVPLSIQTLLSLYASE